MGSDEPALVGRMVELATTYRRYGYRRVTALLRSEGFAVNHKRVERLWRQEGLKVPQKQPKRGRLWLNDGSCVRLRPERKNHVWSYDFVHARTRDGRAFRMLTLIDEFTRECLAIDVARKLKSDDVRKEITKSVLGALAKLRKGLAAEAPKLARGRPGSKAARQAARRKKRIDAKVGELFEHRYLFVRRRLSRSERATLVRISRGQPQLRSLRGLMEEVYRLFDRRCRTATALAKLARLRTRLRRFGELSKTLKKLFAAGLEKALVFLDEKLLGATSNAVERGNRRYRKMRKTVYRVRTHRAIEVRLALDLLREQQARSRAETTNTLHEARAA